MQQTVENEVSALARLAFYENSLIGQELMYQSNRSFNMPPPGTPRALDTFAVPGRREFDDQSLPGGGEFDPHALGVGNLNCTLDYMLINKVSDDACQ